MKIRDAFKVRKNHIRSWPEEGDGGDDAVVVSPLAQSDVLLLDLAEDLGRAAGGLAAPGAGHGEGGHGLLPAALGLPPALQLVCEVEVGVDEDVPAGEADSVEI